MSNTLESPESTPLGGAEIADVIEEAPVPGRAARDLIHGTSALGTAMLLERGCGFAANLLAARIGGASTFGLYSLALATANNVSTYAAGGIASTAIRFSGRYGRESKGYTTLGKALLIIATVSAALGSLVLWAGARPFAALLGKASLTPLLQWSALSVAGMILLECCRGFLVGQRQMRGILLLSSTVGLGMLGLIPLLARVGATSMITAQGAISAGAVLLCLFLFRPLNRGGVKRGEAALPLGPMLREVWTFGMVQLAGLVGLNAAGWWLTSLLARADTTMTQMGFFAIASQLRNMVSLGPSLLIESSLAVMAQGQDKGESTPERVMAACSWVTTFASLALTGPAIAVIPWVLPLLYGRTYAGATAAAAVALSTAVIHVGSGPVSARVSVLSVRTTAIVNTIWAILVAVAAATFIWWGGDAVKAALIYFGAHFISAILLWISLRQHQEMPAGMGTVFITGGATTLALLTLAALREVHPESQAVYSGIMLLLSAVSLSFLSLVGKRHGWLPKLSQVKQILMSRFRSR